MTGANAMSASFFGSGPGSALLGTKRSRAGPGATPGIVGFQIVAGESVVSSASLRGPVRRSMVDAIVLGQLAASCAWSAAVISTRASFCASATVVTVISGPTGGAVPKAGGVPATGVTGGSGASSARALPAAAAPTSPAVVCARNFRRDWVMEEPSLRANRM